MPIEEAPLKFEQQEENSVRTLLLCSDTRCCVPATSLAFDNHFIIFVNIHFATFNNTIPLLSIDSPFSGYTSLGVTTLSRTRVIIRNNGVTLLSTIRGFTSGGHISQAIERQGV